MIRGHARIAADRTEKYWRGLPYPDAIRSFRASKRSVAFHMAGNVSNTRLAAENMTMSPH